MGDVVNFFSGLTYHPSDVKNKGYFVIRSSNIQNNQIVSADDIFVNKDIINVPNVKQGDIIVVVRNGSRKLIGKHAQVLTDMPNTVIGAFMTGVRSKSNFYINALLDSDQFQKEIYKNLGATINQITIGEFRKMRFIITSGNEAQTIGEFFKKIDTLITLQQRKLEQLKQLKRAMLQQLFADKNCKQPILRFKSFNDNWEERKLSDIANYRNGKAHEQYIDMNGIYTVVNSKFISTNGKVKKFSNKPIELLKKGEIAFVLSDVPKGKALAKAYLIDSDNKYSLNQRIAGITPSSDINSYFLYVLMNRNRYFLKFDDGVGQTNLSKKDIEEFKENYPLFDEQQKIANLFSQIQTLISLQQNKHTQLTTLKKYLLQKLFI